MSGPVRRSAMNDGEHETLVASAELPDGLTHYAKTAVFTEKTIPSKLTSSHRTKPGVWGKLVVNEGSLAYVISGPPLIRKRIESPSFAIIEPEVDHLVEVDGPVSFQVEFYRREAAEGQNVHRASRPLWLVLGTASLGCGIAGLVLPLVPTTPFVLFSAFSFARSSPRLHRWLIRHQKFGPLIENWRRHGAIDRRSKILAAAVMVSTPVITWMVGAPVWVLLVQIVVLSIGLLFILSRPEGDGVKRANR